MSPEHSTSLDLAEETLLTAPAVSRPGRMPMPTGERPAVVHPFVRRFGAGPSGGAIEPAAATVDPAAVQDEPAAESPEPWELAARTEEDGEIVEISSLLAAEDDVDESAAQPAWAADEQPAYGAREIDADPDQFGDAISSEEGSQEEQSEDGESRAEDFRTEDSGHSPVLEIGPLGSALPPVEADSAPGPVAAASSDRAWLETLDWDGELAVVTGVTAEDSDAPDPDPARPESSDDAPAQEYGYPEAQADADSTWLAGVPEGEAGHGATSDRSGESLASASSEDFEQGAGADHGVGSSDPWSAPEASEPEATEIADLLFEPEGEGTAATHRDGAGEPEADAAESAEDRAHPDAESEHRAEEGEPGTGAPSDATGAEAAIRSSLAEASAAMARAPGAMPEAFSGVFDEVAERLDNIADSMRRRSRGEPAPSRGSDPLELLLTGFVLGYVSRQGNEPRPPSE